MLSLIEVAEAALVLLVVALACIASYNRFLRRQVFLVLDRSIGADLAQPPQPKPAPSNLAAIERVVAGFRSASIATTAQVASAAAAQGEALNWGWAAFPRPGATTAPVVYIPVMQVQDARAQRTAAALGCASDPRALKVDPCLAAIAKGPLGTQQQTACAGDASFAQANALAYSSGAVASGKTGVAMACGNPAILIDYGALDVSDTNGYVYNSPAAGVWVYGVKPPEGSDPRVQPFNAYNSVYSAFSALSV